MAFRITVRHGGQSTLAGNVSTFTQDVVTVGRRPDNTIAFHPERDPIISGHHAELRVVGDMLELRDLGSANGTFINGERIGATVVKLEPKSVVMLGRDGPTLEIEFVKAAPTASASRVSQTVAAPVSRATSAAEEMSPLERFDLPTPIEQPTPNQLTATPVSESREPKFDVPPHVATKSEEPETVVHVRGSPDAVKGAPITPADHAAPLPMPPIARSPTPASPIAPVANDPHPPASIPAPVVRPPHAPRPPDGHWNSPGSLIMQRTAGKQSIGVGTLMGVMNEVNKRDRRRAWRLVALMSLMCVVAVVFAIAIVLFITLRPSPPGWSEILEDPARSVYVVCRVSDSDRVGSPQGTAWSVKPGYLATNSHVAALLRENPDAHYIARSNCPGGEAPVDLELVSGEMHPGYTAFGEFVERYSIFDARSGHIVDPIPQCDVALLKVADRDVSKQAPPLKLASESTLDGLRGGYEVAFIGFPVEQFAQGGLNPAKPVAQLFTGGVTRVTDAFLSPNAAPAERVMISYQLIVSGGASGSPVFDRSGRVIGFISAINATGLNAMGRSDKSGTAYGPRVDLLRELLDGTVTAKQEERSRVWEAAFREQFTQAQSARVALSHQMVIGVYGGMREADPTMPEVEDDQITPIVEQDVLGAAGGTELSFNADSTSIYFATAVSDNPELRPGLRLSASTQRTAVQSSGKYFTISAPLIGVSGRARVAVSAEGPAGNVHVMVWRLVPSGPRRAGK